MPENYQIDVVVIDDDDDLRETFAAILEINGYRAHTAPDGEAGLALVNELEPMCVLLDFAMPGMNGAKVAAKLRANRPELVIIAITGFDEDAERLLEDAGVDFVLTKPVSTQDLARFLPRITASDT
jgi:CheY-like chemotaxis protein